MSKIDDDAFIANALDMARAFGLMRMADAYPDEIEEAAAFARQLAQRLPADLEPSEEPAHVYSAIIEDAS